MADKKFWKITPHLPVRNLQETIRFYTEKLDFTEEWFYGNPPVDGGCRRDELRMLFWEVGDRFSLAKDLGLIMFVTSVDEVYEEMKQKKLAIIQELKTHDYGIREFAIEDCNGYLLRFAESV